jgi:hypothetical protein
MCDITAVLDEMDAMHAARAATECEPYMSMVARIATLTAERDALLQKARDICQEGPR